MNPAFVNVNTTYNQWTVYGAWMFALMIAMSTLTAAFTFLSLAFNFTMDMSFLPFGWGNNIPNLVPTAIGAMVTGYVQSKAADHRPRGSLWTAIDLAFSALLIAGGLLGFLLAKGPLGSEQIGVIWIVVALIILNLLLDWVRPTGEMVTVNAEPTAVVPIVRTMSATPANIAVGGHATLNWSTEGATSVEINGANVGLNGSMTVSPTATTTYTLVARSPGATATREVTVTVA